MNDCVKFRGSPSNSYEDISLKPTNVTHSGTSEKVSAS